MHVYKDMREEQFQYFVPNMGCRTFTCLKFVALYVVVDATFTPTEKIIL